ncbi:MAG TPA: hypothetical protein VFR34_10780 [Paracoccaceae bacterium]|nr:hypothetical protein [Paracoccaceae bacterium]
MGRGAVRLGGSHGDAGERLQTRAQVGLGSIWLLGRTLLADRNFVTCEECCAVRAMAEKGREENEALNARIVALKAAAKGGATIDSPDALGDCLTR